MKSVILISQEPFDLAAIGTAFHVDMNRSRDSNRLVVEAAWGWFAVEADNGLISEFSEQEMAAVTASIAKPFFAQLVFSAVLAADVALLQMPIDVSTIIDNDHGLVLPLTEIRWRIQTEIEWQTSSS